MTERQPRDLDAIQTKVAGAVSSMGLSDRLWVVGSAGTGKTFAAATGLAARSTGARGEATVLVVAGAAALAEQWAWVAERTGMHGIVVDPSAYRMLQLHTPESENPWNTPQVDLIVTYVDFLKHPRRLQEVLDRGWDVVVLDDPPASAPDTLRHQSISRLWGSKLSYSRVMLTWAGAKDHLPERGDDPVLLMEPQSKVLTHIRIQYSTEDASALEWIYSAVSDLPGSLGRSMMRRAGSSLFALEQSLARLTLRSSNGPVMSLTPDDAEQPTPADRVDESVVIPIVDAIENLEHDPKWETLRSMLDTSPDEGPTVVFTHFSDTAEHLSYLLQDEGVSATALTGAMSAAEKASVVERGRDQVLLVTDVPGPLLLSASRSIHYDVPISPRRLGKRLDRLGHGPGRETEHFVMFDPVFARVFGEVQ